MIHNPKQQKFNSGDFRIDYQWELNAEQLEVVLNGDGACLVLAGAGSGKTRTLVYRVAYLVEKGIDPRNILLVTFTNKAAKEMLGRVETLLGIKPQGLWGGTFHHIGNMILRRYAPVLGYNNNFTILDDDDSKKMLKSALEELGINHKEKFFPKINVLQSVISFSANSQKSVEEIFEGNFSQLDPQLIPIISALGKVYAEKKLKANVMDFDDLLVNWLKLLQTNKEAKQRLAAQFHYILVDEYQDTNKIQSEIIHELGSIHKNVLVVGDDCQSIYSFRAADINNILGFPKRFDGAKIFKLTSNYRSSPEILRLANQSISRNFNQYQKELQAKCEKKSKPVLAGLADAETQAEFVCKRVLELKEEGASLNDIAILFRSSFQTMEVELELNRQGISYIMRGGIRFFEQAHIKDVVCYLKILANFKDEVAWKRCLLLYDGIGPAGAERVWQSVITENDLAGAMAKILNSGFPEKIRRGLEKINGLWEFLKNPKEDFIASAILQILRSDYEDYLKNNFENAKERIEDLNQLAGFALNYTTLDEFLSDATLSEGFRAEQSKGYQKGAEDNLVLSTIHQAKGLEWKKVFLIGLAEGQFPHWKIYDRPHEVEEERRLFYVAVTRAKDELYLTYPLISNSFSTGPSMNHKSRFLSELNDNLFEPFSVNDSGEDYSYEDDDGEEIDPEKPLGKHEFLRTVRYE